MKKEVKKLILVRIKSVPIHCDKLMELVETPIACFKCSVCGIRLPAYKELTTPRITW